MFNEVEGEGEKMSGIVNNMRSKCQLSKRGRGREILTDMIKGASTKLSIKFLSSKPLQVINSERPQM